MTGHLPASIIAYDQERALHLPLEIRNPDVSGIGGPLLPFEGVGFTKIIPDNFWDA